MLKTQCLKPGYFGRCRKCSGCKAYKIRAWVLRMQLESQSYPSDQSLFVTLTYDDQHLPGSPGEAKKSFQDFAKRLRKNLKVDNLKYFSVLERGSRTGRYHWHAIMYGLSFTSAIRHHVRGCWRNGFVDVKLSTPGRMTYVCKYILKDDPIFLRSQGLGASAVPRLQAAYDKLDDKTKMRSSDQSRMRVTKDGSIRSTSAFSRVRLNGYIYAVPPYLKNKLNTGVEIKCVKADTK